MDLVGLQDNTSLRLLSIHFRAPEGWHTEDAREKMLCLIAAILDTCNSCVLESIVFRIPMEWCIDSESGSDNADDDDDDSEFGSEERGAIEDESGGDLAPWLGEVQERDCFRALTHVVIEVYAPVTSLEEEVPHDLAMAAVKDLKRHFQAWDDRGILTVNGVPSESTPVLGNVC